MDRFTHEGSSRPRSDELPENDVGDEVEGSFIILPSNCVHTTQDDSSPEDDNLNVFQLGQLQQSNMQKSALLTALDNQACPTPTKEMSSIKETLEGASSSCVTPADTSNTLKVSCRESEKENTEEGNMKSVISSVSFCSTDSTTSFEEASHKVTQLLEENVGLRAFVRELNEKQKEFLENCKELEMVIARSQAEAKEQELKYDRSRSVIETLRVKIAELEAKVVEGTPRNSLDGGDTELDIRRLERQLSEKESLLKEEIQQTQELKELLRKMESELSEAKASASSLGSLQAERDVLSDAFEDSKQTISKLADLHLKDQEELKDVKGTNMALVQQLAETKALFEDQLRMNTDLQNACAAKSEDIKQLLEKSQLIRNHADALETKMNSTVAELEDIKAKMGQMEHDMQKKISELEADIAEKNIFLAQMEEYRNDFEDERRDKIAMREQKVRLADELTTLQMQLEAKEAELAQLHRTHLQLANQHLSSTATGSASSNHRPSSDEFVFIPQQQQYPASAGSTTFASDVNEFQCPICETILQTRMALVTHAATCGEPDLPVRPPTPPSPTPLQYN